MNIDKKLNPICLTVKLSIGHLMGSKKFSETRKFYCATKEAAEKELTAIQSIGFVISNSIVDKSIKVEKEKTEAAKVSKLIREDLKSNFPTIKFNVHSSTFSMGNLINIYWTDGPTSKTIEYLLAKYLMGYFDEMTDSYVHSNFRSDIPQVKYLTFKRSMSDLVTRQLMKSIKTENNNIEVNFETMSQLIRTKFSETNFNPEINKKIVLDIDDYFEKL